MGRVGRHGQLVDIGASQSIEKDCRVKGNLQTTHGINSDEGGLCEFPEGILPKVFDAHRTRKPLATSRDPARHAKMIFCARRRNGSSADKAGSGGGKWEV